tara:strand:- start:4541 stop:4723 length:183 start_codon:yes stop_codon:yes gene_type:complete
MGAPTLFHFTLDDDSIYEVVAVSFRDACLTLEEECPEIKMNNIKSVIEHENPVPGYDTIH